MINVILYHPEIPQNTGNIMRNKEGFPTNGLFGFVNMMNKIINEESEAENG